VSGSAKSVLLFGIYIACLGILLVFLPNPLLRLVNVPPTREVWIRLAGMLLIFMGFFYVMAGRANLVPFFRWTLVTRGAAAAFVTGFVLTGLIPPVILLFWLGDLAGALWTLFTLRAEGRLIQGKR
jgi:hypothetical protein